MTDFRDTPEPRHNLPHRRLSETMTIITAEGHMVQLTVGFDPSEPDRPREVFYSGGFRSGAALEFVVQDACVLISLLLQHGHRPAAIAKSLARTEQPIGGMAYASIIGQIAEKLSGRHDDPVSTAQN